QSTLRILRVKPSIGDFRRVDKDPGDQGAAPPMPANQATQHHSTSSLRPHTRIPNRGGERQAVGARGCTQQFPASKRSYAIYAAYHFSQYSSHLSLGVSAAILNRIHRL